VLLVLVCCLFSVLSSLSPCPSLLSLTAEKFLENGSVQGGRAAAVGTYRDVDSDDDSESDDESVDLDRDSEEEEEEGDDDAVDNAVIMPPKTKAATPQKKAAIVLPAAMTSPKAKKNPGDIDCPAMLALIKGFHKARIRQDGHVAFNFSAIYPYYYYRFTSDNCNYVQVVMSLSSTDPADLTVEISDDGKHVIVKNAVIAETLLHPRLFQVLYQIQDADLGDHLINQAGSAAQTYVQEQVGEDGDRSIMVIPLPFECQQQFNDPYMNAGRDNGMAMSYFPHPRYTPTPFPDPTDPIETRAFLDQLLQNPPRRVCIMSVTLKSAALPKARSGTVNETIYHDAL
jgi:hypothetical protein